MTRINTNVSSLVAQKTLARSNSQLQEALTRLSTGLRINKGKDDPAGLIASEVLRSDIISTQRAITNSERANQLIGTADSALGQVSSLLNDIRGLVSEAANKGALSDDQLKANQLQIDSSLEAIDRIAQITSFQGRKLLDGSLAFLENGIDNTQIQDLQIDQANFGTLSAIGVNVDVVKQAEKGTLNYSFGAISAAVTLEIGGRNGAEAFNFGAGSNISDIASAVNLVSDATGVEATVQKDATKGAITVSSFGADNDIVITADQAGLEEGDIRVKYSLGGTSSTTATYTAAIGNDPATIDVALQTKAYVAASATVDPNTTPGNSILITAKNKGTDFNGVTVDIGFTGVAGAEAVTYNETTKVLTVNVNAASTTAQVVAAFSSVANEEVKNLFTAAIAETNNTGAAVFATGAAAAVATLADGVNGGDIVATADEVVAAINASTAGPVVTASLAEGSDGTGVASVFQEFAYTGTPESNTRLQFLAPENSPKIRFTSVIGQSLGVDTTTDPVVKTYSSVTYQNAAANGSLVFTAKQKGPEFDGYSIFLKDNANVTGGGGEFAVLDKEAKTVTINVDTTVSTAADVVAAVNGNSYVNSLFQAANFGSSDGTGVITVPAPVTLTTGGGLVDEGTLIVKLATDASGRVTTTANDLINFFNDSANSAVLSPFGISITNAEKSDGSGLLSATTTDVSFATSGTDLQDAQATTTTNAVNGTNARILFTAVTAGSLYDGVTVVFQNEAGLTAGVDEHGEYEETSKTLTFFIAAGTTTAQHIEDIFDSLDANYDAALAEKFTAAAQGTGAGVVTVTDTGVTTGGVVDAGSENGAALLGNSDLAETGLTFQSTTFGSEAFVSVKALSGTFSLKDANGDAKDRSTGKDINARINGIQAVGRGLLASINTSSLDIAFSVASTVVSGTTLSFSIVGGGAQFQLGPDVVSNQQARLGITALNTAKLGGVSGKLFELKSGGARSISNDVGGAAKIVDEVISLVTSLRGRLGAFQKTTLDTNIFTLNDTLENLTDAESSIRDADFAAESARLTRAQILVQSGTSVLAIANQNPQNVLALLR